MFRETKSVNEYSDYIQKQLQIYTENNTVYKVLPHDFNRYSRLYRLTSLVYNISVSKLTNEIYILAKEDKTKYFINSINLHLLQFKEDYADFFSDSYSNFILIFGKNSSMFYYNGKDFSKTSGFNNFSPVSYITNEMPYHIFNPYIYAFIKALQKLVLPTICENKGIKEIVNHFRDDNEFPLQSNEENLLEITPKNLLKLVWEETKSKEFRKHRNDFNSRPNKNLKRLINYIDNLFDQETGYKQILALRVDIGYQKKPGTISPNIDIKDELHQAQVDFGNLLKSKRVFDNIIGYVWKLEFCFGKRFNYYLLFLFDGSKVFDDAKIGNAIGEQWEAITKERSGIYYSYSSNKDDVKKELGIGIIDNDDKNLINGLKSVTASFFIKTDYYSRLDLSAIVGNQDQSPKKNRTFGRTCIKRNL
jgi:hypothetical protein